MQIKARSMDVKKGDAALFAAVKHEPRENYYFVFYSERLDTMFILSSEEFLQNCSTNISGKNIGIRSIWFNGHRKNKSTGEKEEYVKPQFEKYVTKDFSRLK